MWSKRGVNDLNRTVLIFWSLRNSAKMLINPGNAGADIRQDFPRNGVGLRGQFARLDFLVSLAAEGNDFIADTASGHAGDIDHDLIHGHAAADGTTLTAHEHMAGVGVEPEGGVHGAHGS